MRALFHQACHRQIEPLLFSSTNKINFIYFFKKNQKKITPPPLNCTWKEIDQDELLNQETESDRYSDKDNDSDAPEENLGV